MLHGFQSSHALSSAATDTKGAQRREHVRPVVREVRYMELYSPVVHCPLSYGRNDLCTIRIVIEQYHWSSIIG